MTDRRDKRERNNEMTQELSEAEAAWNEFRDSPEYTPTDRYPASDVFRAGYAAALSAPQPREGDYYEGLEEGIKIGHADMQPREAAPSDSDLRTAVFEAISNRLGEHPKARNHEVADSGEYETRLSGLFDVEALAEFIAPALLPLLSRTSHPVQVEVSEKSVAVMAKHMANAASDWVDNCDDDDHPLEHSNWEAYTDDARRALAALGGGDQ